jgi:glycosyltransferase involved in cell wall biosynthesis
VGDIVDFPNGSVPVEEISYHIGSAHVGVVATRKDDTTELMLPLKLSEYLAMGIPVVCSRLRVVEEYTQGKGVLFYDHNDPQDLANALLRLYRDPVFLQRLTDETGFFRAQYSWKEQKLTLRKIFTALGGIEL